MNRPSRHEGHWEYFWAILIVMAFAAANFLWFDQRLDVLESVMLP